MGKRQKEREKRILKKKNIIFFFIACILVSTIFTFNYSNSRYMGTINADEDVLAVPILTLSDSNQSYTIDNMLPGDSQEFSFYVSNVDGEDLNEILLSYTLTIEIGTEIPLTAELYECDLDAGTETKIELTDNKTPVQQMEIVEEDADKLVKNYKLKIIWDSADNSYEYAGKSVTCKVILEGVQVTN